MTKQKYNLVDSDFSLDRLKKDLFQIIKNDPDAEKIIVSIPIRKVSNTNPKIGSIKYTAKK